VRHCTPFLEPYSTTATPSRLDCSLQQSGDFSKVVELSQKHWEPQATWQVVETPISSVGFNINIKTPHIHTFYTRNSQDKVNQKTDSPVVKYFLLGNPQ
jgi:predicted nucleotide-binding protein